MASIPIEFNQNDRNLLDSLQSSEFGADEVYFIRNLKSHVFQLFDQVGNASQHTKKEVGISKIDILNTNVSIDNSTSKIKATSIHAANFMPLSGSSSLNLNGNVISNREIRTSAIKPLSGADSLTIAGVQFSSNSSNSTLNIKSIQPTDSTTGIDIDNVNVKGNTITAQNIVSDVTNGIQTVNVNGTLMKDNGSIQLNTLTSIGTNALYIENSIFAENTAHIPILQTSKIQSHLGGTIQFEGLVENIQFVSGATFEAPTLRANTIEPIDGTDLRLSGNIILDNAALTSGPEGFSLGGVEFREGNLYVNNLFRTTQSTTGFQLEGVQFQDGIVRCKQIDIEDPNNPSIAGSLNVSNLTLRNIYEENAGQGITLNQVKIQDKYLMLPARDIVDDSNMKYAKLYYLHEHGKVYIESGHGDVMTPPEVINWQDWDPYNNDQNVQLEVTHTRFTVIDQSVWVSVDVNFVFQNNIPNGYKEVWITLPQNYPSVENAFTTFCMIENQNNKNIQFAHSLIDGNRNRNFLFFQSLTDFQSNTSYKMHVNMVYEYEPMNRISTNPWQSWFPAIKDRFIERITVHNSRYYKIGRNMWASFDLSIQFYNPPTNLIYPNQKNQTYVSLPPGAHAKNVTYSNPILIINKLTHEHSHGLVVVGTSQDDEVLDTTNMKFKTNTKFENGVEYFIKGQIVFEETTISPLDFFFDTLDWDLNNSADQKSFTIESNENELQKFEITTLFENHTLTKGDWSNFVSHDSNIIRFMSSNGLDRYLQVMIIPFITKSRAKVPWRIIQMNNNIHFQITTDGHRYVDQFVLEREYLHETHGETQ